MSVTDVSEQPIGSRFFLDCWTLEDGAGRLSRNVHINTLYGKMSLWMLKCCMQWPIQRPFGLSLLEWENQWFSKYQLVRVSRLTLHTANIPGRLSHNFSSTVLTRSTNCYVKAMFPRLVCLTNARLTTPCPWVQVNNCQQTPRLVCACAVTVQCGLSGSTAFFII